MFHVGFVRAIDSNTKRKMLSGSIAATLIASSMVVMLGFFMGVFPLRPPSTFNGEMIGGDLLTINQSVSTSFGTYNPYSEDFTPNAPSYTISRGLSNVVNLNEFSYLTSEELLLLETNGFVVRRQSTYDQIYEILEANKENGIPQFVTSDSVLHAFHICYDLALRETEVYTFWDLLGNLSKSMLQDSIDQYNVAPAGDWKEAARMNIIFFTVASYLIDNTTAVHSDVASEVMDTLSFIESAEGITGEWFMNYEEDFSQFIPRGHYTRSETLEKYFLAMMWYGRVQFRLVSELDRLPTQQAILIALSLSNIVDGLLDLVTGYNVWDALYEPTAFFVGFSDDLTPPEYKQLVDEIYGETPNWALLQNEDLLDDFIQAASNLRDPLILGSPVGDDESDNVTKGMHFMGQRFIPDSYILGQLVYDNVGTASNPRLMPMGLDVMSAFGSERAYNLLEDEKEYANYESQMEMLRDYVKSMTPSNWTQNLYYLWMYSLLPLLATPGEGYPYFMQNQAWIDKQLNTALASWTELRHDTILYAKQSYTARGGITFDPDRHGYVEPIPELYSRLASLCAMTLDGLGVRNLLSSVVELKLNTLLDFCLNLRDISIKELTGVPLNSTDWDIIKYSYSTLRTVSSIPTEELISTDTDRYMSLIADVHTDPNSGNVLEEGVGDPLIIIVAVTVDGQIVLTRGGTFSYYEFSQPMDSRLTDEDWREILETGSAPAFPDWTSSFISSYDGISAASLDTKRKDDL